MTQNAAGRVVRRDTGSSRALAYLGAAVTVVLAGGKVQAGRRALLWKGRKGQTHSREKEFGAEVRSRCHPCSPYRCWMKHMMIRLGRCSAALSRELRGAAGSVLCSRAQSGS